jgi:hypothetical protein
MTNLEFRLTLILIGLAFFAFVFGILELLYAGRIENYFVLICIGISALAGILIMRFIFWIIKKVRRCQ